MRDLKKADIRPCAIESNCVGSCSGVSKLNSFAVQVWMANKIYLIADHILSSEWYTYMLIFTYMYFLSNNILYLNLNFPIIKNLVCDLSRAGILPSEVVLILKILMMVTTNTRIDSRNITLKVAKFFIYRFLVIF